MLMKNIFKILLLSFSIISCTVNIKKLSENSEVGEMLGSILNSRYSYLVKYLKIKPVKVMINPDPSVDCPSLNREKNILYIPRKNYRSFNLKITYAAKSLYEYMMLTKYDINQEIPFELRLLSSYLEIDFILNHLSDEMLEEIKGTILEKKICSYIMDENSFEKIIRDEEYTYSKACARPTLELSYYREISKKLKKSLNDVYADNFFRVLQEMEIEKAKRGNITYYDAYRNYYYASSEPEMEMYRNMRKDIYSRIKSLNSFKGFYTSEIKKMKKKRNSVSKLISTLTFCTK